MTVSNQRSLLLYSGVAIAIVILFNLISRNWFFRLDFTDNKMYSLSESSRQVVKKVDDLLTMKVYFTDNLPGDYANNRRYLQDILEEYAAYSDGQIRFEFYKPETDEKLEQEAQKSGIAPVQLQVIENDKLEIKKVYMGMSFLYEDRREVIPVIQTTTGLEYEITTKIKRLVEQDKRWLAFGTFTGQSSQNDNLTQLLQESYQVRNVTLDQPVPENINVLLVNGVADSVAAGELENLKTYLNRGGNLLLAQGRIKADLQQQRARAIQSNLFSLLEEVGLHLRENLVLDSRCSQVTITQNRGFFQINSAVDYPFFPLIHDFGDHPIVGSLEQIRLLFPSEIDYLPAGADSSSATPLVPLFTTSAHSAIMETSFNLSPLQNPALANLNQSGKVVAALASVPSGDQTGVSQIILVADSRFLDDSGGGSIPENHIFVLNAADYLMGDSELVSLRSREITTRPLEPIEDAARARMKWLNILLPPLLIIGLGILRWKLDARRSATIEEIYG